jgi:two-component system sensor histidine kinase/response regulator
MTFGQTMSGSYSTVFVVLSVLIAILSSYAALDLSGRIVSVRTTKTRLTWLGLGAFAMGIGIWSMHYIGMLAYRMPMMTVSYDWPTVLVSMLAAILASALALFIVSRSTLTYPVTAAASIVMGGGIAAMHYIGMAAMRVDAVRVYSLPLVALSIASAIVISFAALRLTFSSRHISTVWSARKTACAIVMGLAIPIMHYLGMAAVSFVHGTSAPPEMRHSVAISDLGAASIALVTIVMLFLVFVSAMLDRRFSRHAEELEGSEQRYRRILSATFDAFIGTNSSGVITDWNAQATTTFGWTAAEALGTKIQTMLELEQPVDGQTLLGMLDSSHMAPLQSRVAVTARHRTGMLFPAEMAISEISIGNKRTFAAFVHDITERKIAERSTEEARVSAEAANRAKSEFLANMSHEIRTPLNGVIGMTDLTLETELTREQRDYLETVKFSADSLLTVINDILDFSKIEAGKVDLETIRFDLRGCIETTLKTMALRADEKGLELLCDIEYDVPEAVIGDPGRLRQIIVNLIGNAVKFTSVGEVTLRVRMESEGGGEHIHFVVSDTGIGIPASKRDSIFASFSQADTSTTRQFGGTGLGLTISRRLIELMDGRIWIESEVGKGSDFHFIVALPAGEPMAQPEEVDGTLAQLSGVKTLIIDDNKTNRRILEGLLQLWGMNVKSAADGETALEMLAVANASGVPFRLVLTDMHMPKMDGFMMVQQMYADTSLAPSTVMMLSSGGHHGDASRCQSLGIAAYLLKPVRRSELQEAILRALNNTPAEERSPMITQNTLLAERPSNQFLTILLAEDNEVNQKLAVRMLERRGHTVMVASNGREAVESVPRHHFDLVLMDVQMPEMDGIEATQKIRHAEEGTDRYLPIVAMTALVMKGDRERCLAARMDGYISKPINVQELDAILETYAEKKSKQTMDVPLHSANTAPQASVNAEELLSRIDGDREFISELLEIFSTDYPQKVGVMRAALQSQDFEGFRRAAHGLKGALANLAASRAAAMASELEQMGGAADLSDAPARLALLDAELPHVVEALREISRESVA